MSDALINGLAGAGGGIIAQLITYPLQTVNTRQQTERDPSKSAARDGAVRQMLEVVKQEGWGRLYGGLAPSLVGTAASQGVYYYFYQIFRNKAETAAQERWRKGSGDGSVGMFQSLVVAALAGCVNVLLTNPIWVVVARMQTHKKTNFGSPNRGLQSLSNDAIDFPVVEHLPYRTSHVIQELYDEAGMWGFWKGVVPTLIMVSNPSIQFMLYETLVKKIKRRRDLKAKGAEGLTALEDRSTGRMIGFGCESHGLYRLQQPSLVGLAATSPLLIHAQLEHPDLDKLKQLRPSLSHLKSLFCESCQLGKHVRSSFFSSYCESGYAPFCFGSF